MGTELKNCTQLRIAVLQHIFTQVKSNHSKNYSSMTKKVFSKKAT